MTTETPKDGLHSENYPDGQKMSENNFNSSCYAANLNEL
jgi:hypothetical protein